MVSPRTIMMPTQDGIEYKGNEHAFEKFLPKYVRCLRCGVEIEWFAGAETSKVWIMKDGVDKWLTCDELTLHKSLNS